MSDKHSLRQVLNVQTDGLFQAVDVFRTLLPHDRYSSSLHHGEEGRFVEALLAEFLRQHLPGRASVASGFVVDLETGVCSGQMDILVYDGVEYVPFLKYGDAVVVPRQSLLAAVSVKKKLRYPDVCREAQRLSVIGDMCGGEGTMRPYLSLFAFDIESETKIPGMVKKVFDHVEKAYPENRTNYSTNQLIDSVMVLNKFLLKKKRWRDQSSESRRDAVPYLWTGGEGSKRNFYLQEILHGVFFCLDQRIRTGHPSNEPIAFPQGSMKRIGALPICCEDRPPQIPGLPELFTDPRPR